MYYVYIMKKYDVIVIGSGGGSKITRPAANLGYNVAIIEKDQLGGTCLNRGCIPSKMLIHPADIIRELQDANRFDLTIDTSFKFDAKKFVSDVNKEINEESQSIEPLYEAHKNVTYYNDTASFEKDYVLRVGDHTITAPKIFIAAGARPNIPNYKGLQNTPYWTSTEALKATSLPKSLIIFGGGYIACELGHYFSALGVKVTFLLRSELIFSHDDDIKYEFTRMVRRYSDVIEFAVVNEVSYKENCFSVFFTDKDGGSKTLQANQLLVATGIIPNSDTLSLENTSIECDENGYINVNDYLETASKGIYSFGDIIGKYFFRHTANFEGQYLFDTVFKKDHKNPINYKPIPYSMFTYPQIAGVGLTEKECKNQNVDFVIGKNDYIASGMGSALRSDHGFVKLLFERKTKLLIGAHIIGKEAATMIHTLIAFMSMNASYEDILNMIYVHPALPEVIRNAARKCVFK